MFPISPLFANLIAFKEFILDAYEQKLKSSGKISENTTLSISDINLVADSEVVLECLDELGIDDTNLYFENSDFLRGSQISNGQFEIPEQEPDKLNEDGEETDQKSTFIIEYLNNFFQQDNVKILADTDKDGNLSQSEILNYIDTMNNYDGDASNLSLTDLLSAASLIETLSSDETPPNEETVETPPISSPTPVNAEPAPPTGRKTRVPASAQVPKYDSNNSPILENWSIDELNQELSNKESKLQETTNAMNSVINGSDSTIKQLENQENLAHQKLEEYKQTHNNELSKKLVEFDKKTAAVKDAENNVFENEQNIINATDLLAQKETALTNATSFKTGLESSLSTLEGQLNRAQAKVQGDPTADKSAVSKIQSKISQVKSKITEAQTAIETAKQARDEAKAQKEAFEAKKAGLNEALKTAENDLKIVEDEMKKLEGYNEIKDFLDSYNEAKQRTRDYKASAIESAKTSIAQQRVSIDKIKTEINNKKIKQAQIENKYNPTVMDDLVNYFGEDYISLLSQDEIYALQKQIGETGMSNVGNMPSKCLQAGTNYMRWIEDRSGVYASNFSMDKDTVLAGIKSTLDSGRSTNIMVTTKAGKRHFVTVIGYKASAGETLKESDLLVIDTYDGQVDGMGGSGGIEGNYRELFAQDKGFRYDVLSDKYTWSVT